MGIKHNPERDAINLMAWKGTRKGSHTPYLMKMRGAVMKHLDYDFRVQWISGNAECLSHGGGLRNGRGFP
jgi:hypothetical protein